MKYKFLTSERLGGVFKAVKETVATGENVTVFCAAASARQHLTAGLNLPFLYIVRDYLSAQNACDNLNALLGGGVVFIPQKEDLLISASVVRTTQYNNKLTALTELLLGTAKGAVITAETLLQRFAKPEYFKNAIVVLSTLASNGISFKETVLRLARAGYTRVERVGDKGEFAVRGDIIDIYPINSELPVRAEFFGDNLETLRLFEAESGMVAKRCESIVIPPKTDLFISKNACTELRYLISRTRKGANSRFTEILNSFEDRLPTVAETDTAELPLDASFSYLTPFFENDLGSVLDYLPQNSVIAFDETRSVDDKLKLYVTQHKTRVESLAKSGEAGLIHESSLIAPKSLYAALEKFALISYQIAPDSNPIFDSNYQYALRGVSSPKFGTDPAIFINDVNGRLIRGERVYIFAGSGVGADVVRRNLYDGGLTSTLSVDGETDDLICVIPDTLYSGFYYPDFGITAYATGEVYKRAAARKTSRQKSDAFLIPKVGDYIVHDEYGIGIFEGVVTKEVRKGEKHDYCLLRYAGDGKVYIPVEYSDRIEKYLGGGTPALHRLGGKEFEKTKEKVRSSVKHLAVDLVALYESRLNRLGHKYDADTDWQRELEESFEFEETEDQLTAISEIKEDMESGKVMDRLLCGDVGFGKTEVAVRIVFKTVIEGKQAAVLCPTTILCTQHYKTFSERFKNFGLHVDMLSRLNTKEYEKDVLQNLASGKTNVVISTHRLLSKDVVFHDLGLLVLDEEQRFGVEHKEKIKALKTNVNVLTMSATPIPRTLHMSLSGIRDISTLETPPVNRLPVETYVCEYSDALVKDAAEREIERNGQVFILFNEVAKIHQFFVHIQNLLGAEINVIYAHGQMPPIETEERIRAFYNKQASVLIATTIIENGIDIPDANTLIVVNAHKLGLAEMYQLRGRVGRSTSLAHAYFTLPEGMEIGETAARRLDAILNNTSLGSGFSIAVQDMEIRGAGSVLGAEQHGNMERVGYEMYVRLLNETVSEMKGETLPKKLNTEVLTDGSVSLPHYYIDSSDARVRFYRRISDLTALEEEASLLNDLSASYGQPPVEVRNLISVGLVKNLASRLGVKKVAVTANAAGLTFVDTTILSNERFFYALERYGKDAVLSPNDPITVIFKPLDSAEKRINAVKRFLIDASRSERE